MKPKFKIGDYIRIKENAVRIMYPDYYGKLDKMRVCEGRIFKVIGGNYHSSGGKFRYKIEGEFYFCETVVEQTQLSEILEIEAIL